LDDKSKQAELEYLENGEIKKGGKAIIRLISDDKDNVIIPTVVETYQRNSNAIFTKGFIALLNLYHPKERVGVDVFFGEPIHIGEFLSQRDENGKKNTTQKLAERVLDVQWDMRKELEEINKGDPQRSLLRYYFD
jgi:hypothetical protein